MQKKKFTMARCSLYYIWSLFQKKERKLTLQKGNNSSVITLLATWVIIINPNIYVKKLGFLRFILTKKAEPVLDQIPKGEPFSKHRGIYAKKSQIFISITEWKYLGNKSIKNLIQGAEEIKHHKSQWLN